MRITIIAASVLLLSAGFLLTMHLFVLLLEEAGLERRFGSSYIAYKQAVNRWLPYDTDDDRGPSS